jgi:hypothetical protein
VYHSRRTIANLRVHYAGLRVLFINLSILSTAKIH